MSEQKQLIVNADDFGYVDDINAGIVEAHQNGILTAATLMANGRAFEDAVRLSHAVPSLDVGAHLVLVQGHSVATGEPLPPTWKELLKALSVRRIDPYRELKAQVEKIARSGIRPSHFDTHKHTHVIPRVFSAVLRLAREFEVPFIRLPFDAGWWPGWPMEAWYRRRVRRGQLRATDHFCGFQLTGVLQEESLMGVLNTLRPGSTELMCHPGYLRAGLAASPTRLKKSRERELEALTSPAVRQVLEAQGIMLTNYRELELSVLTKS